MEEPYQDIVNTFPPEKSPKGEMVLLTFHTKSGDVVRLRLSDYVARHLGTQSVLLSARPSVLGDG